MKSRVLLAMGAGHFRYRPGSHVVLEKPSAFEGLGFRETVFVGLT